MKEKILKNKKLIICLSVSVVAFIVIAVYIGVQEYGLPRAVDRSMADNNAVVELDDDSVPLASSAEGGSDELKSEAKKAFELVNDRRIAQALPVLAYSNGLEDAACIRAKEISELYSHTRPDWSDWYTVDSAIMYGEVLARYYDNAEGAVDFWCYSTVDKEKILDGNYKTAGVAVYEKDGERYWALELGY